MRAPSLGDLPAQLGPNLLVLTRLIGGRVDKLAGPSVDEAELRAERFLHPP